ncbi:MAG TPA: peptidoglycan-associated lipoprotein Pal [Burkholderiales bacterium]|nr:peptidoglycan-associated lipoprotein Pal [Burkholderiales bacterium]
MTKTIPLRLSGKISLLLVCVALGACSSMQKSSSGGSEQSAAPISDATPSQAAGKSDNAQSSGSSSPNAGAASSANGAQNAGAAGAAAGSKPAGAESNAATSDSEEAAQLKRQLAEQDAQINRLRNDQQADAARIDADSAKMKDAEAGTSQPDAAAGTSQSSAAKARGSDDAAVFPDGSNAPGVGAANMSSGQRAGGADTSDADAAAAASSTLDRSIYFAYDEASVQEKYDDMLLANASFLKAHPTLKTEVQGNCDERGSREYNLALGARRAEAVRRALELAGADGSRITAISYGAEKPVALGKDEASYSKNRRADIVY